MACRFVYDAGVSWQEEQGKPQWGCAGGEDEVGGSGLRKGSRVGSRAAAHSRTWTEQDVCGA